MFYQVKVFDSRGQLKKVVSSRKLSNRFWRLNSSAPPDYVEGFGKSDEWSSKRNMSHGKVSLDESV